MRTSLALFRGQAAVCSVFQGRPYWHRDQSRREKKETARRRRGGPVQRRA